MAGELSFHTILEVGVAVVVVGEEEVVGEVGLIWSVMSVASLVISLVNAVYVLVVVVVVEGEGDAAVVQDTGGAQVMVGGMVIKIITDCISFLGFPPMKVNSNKFIILV